MFRGGHYSQRRRPQNTGLLLLALQIFRIGLDNIPPVTLMLLGAQVFVFAYPIYAPHYRFPPVGQVCLSAHAIVQKGEYLRLFQSAFFHGDDMHLYYNMVSLIWKGRQLEPLMGAETYSMAIAFFVVTSGTFYIAAVYALEAVYGYGAPLTVPDCAVGFSGVLFAMKVLLSAYNPGQQVSIMGLFTVQDKYAYWVELVLIHFIAPNASFLGHLCGIAAGLLYLQVPRIRSPMSRLYNRAQIQSRALNRGEGYRANNSMNNTRHPQARIARTSAAPMASYPCIMPGCSFVAKDSADLNQHINTRHFSDQDDVPPLSSSSTNIDNSGVPHTGDTSHRTVHESPVDDREKLRQARLARFEKR